MSEYENIDDVVDYLIQSNKGSCKNTIANLIGYINGQDKIITKVHSALGTNSHIEFYARIQSNMDANKRFTEAGYINSEDMTIINTGYND